MIESLMNSKSELSSPTFVGHSAHHKIEVIASYCARPNLSYWYSRLCLDYLQRKGCLVLVIGSAQQ